jgi:hypothetical protein
VSLQEPLDQDPVHGRSTVEAEDRAEGADVSQKAKVDAPDAWNPPRGPAA